jgi:hypothetical protein
VSRYNPRHHHTRPSALISNEGSHLPQGIIEHSHQRTALILARPARDSVPFISILLLGFSCAHFWFYFKPWLTSCVRFTAFRLSLGSVFSAFSARVILLDRSVPFVWPFCSQPVHRYRMSRRVNFGWNDVRMITPCLRSEKFFNNVSTMRGWLRTIEQDME